MEYIDTLSNVSLFTMVKKGDLKRISKMATHHFVESGGIITQEGDYDGRLFVIIKGRVRIVKDLGGKNERDLGMLGENTYFGEMALVGDFHRTASAVAVGDTELISLDKWDFRTAIKKYPSIAIEIMQVLSRRLVAEQSRPEPGNIDAPKKAC